MADAYSPLLSQLIQALQCLPGVGVKTAQRMAFYLLERDRGGADRLSNVLDEALRSIRNCERCRMLTEDRDMLEDLVAAAVNDAVRRVETTTQEKMGGLTAGMPMPPGFKLPF